MLSIPYFCLIQQCRFLILCLDQLYQDLLAAETKYNHLKHRQTFAETRLNQLRQVYGKILYLPMYIPTIKSLFTLITFFGMPTFTLMYLEYDLVNNYLFFAFINTFP